MPGVPDPDCEEAVRDMMEKAPPLEADKDPEIPEKPYEKLSGLYKYKGFLYIKCPVCGKIRAFCSRKEVEGYQCMSCGADIPFTEELTSLNVDCECGHHSYYRTNMKDKSFDVNCIDCGTPVAVTYNAKKKLYETMKEK